MGMARATRATRAQSAVNRILKLNVLELREWAEELRRREPRLAEILVGELGAWDAAWRWEGAQPADAGDKEAEA